jgi:hypothetical protein
MVKGAMSGHASATSTSTEKVSLSTLKPNDSTGISADDKTEMAWSHVVKAADRDKVGQP